MRQFFTFRFWLSVVAVVALLGILYTQVRKTDVGEPARADGPAVREVDLVTRVLAARLDPGWTVRDGMTVSSAEIDTSYGATLAIKAGTLGELQCDALATPGGCYMMADTLGNAIVWFVLLPYPPSADRATLPAIDLLLDDVTQAQLTNGWVLPLASVVDRSLCPEDTTSLANFVNKFGDEAVTILDVARQQIVAVDCPGLTPDPAPTTTVAVAPSPPRAHRTADLTADHGRAGWGPTPSARPSGLATGRRRWSRRGR